MKVLLSILLYLSFNSFCFAQSTFDEDRMYQVLEQLQLPKENVAMEFVSYKELPSGLNETVLVIPEIENDITELDEIFYELRSHILIVNTVTGEIKYHFTENSTKNGWISDAIAIDEIIIDTTSYILAENSNAFGIKIFFSNSSQPNPYRHNYLSLYMKDKGTLKKVLDNYTLEKFIGEFNVNMNECYADSWHEKNQLNISKSITNGYNNIVVSNSSIHSIFEWNKEGDCEEVEKSREEKVIVLKYANGVYK